MEQVTLKTIIFFSTIFFIISFFTLYVNDERINKTMRFSQAMFHALTILTAISGLGVIK